jgi:hypothetical protein
MSTTFLAALRMGSPNWVFLLLGLLPTVFVYAVNPLHRIYSFHGFFHLGVVYRILWADLPPENPIFAGAPPLYPWACHMIAAALSRSLTISPAWAFTLINLCCLVVTLVLIFLTAKRAFVERSAALIAVLLAIFGLGFTSTLHFNGPLLRRFGIFLEFRGLPPAMYFFEIQADAFGLAFYSLFLFSVLRLVGRRPQESQWRALATLAAALIGAGFFYPFYFTAALLCAFAIVAMLAAGRLVPPAIVIGVLGVAIVSALAVFPYLLSLVEPKAPEAHIHLAPGLGYALRKLAMYLALVAPLGLVMASERGSLVAIWRARPAESRVLLAAVVVPSLLYFVTAAPLADEFKFQSIAVIGIGILGAPCLAAFHRRRPRFAFLVVTAFLLPMASEVVFTAIEPWSVVDPVVERGTAILAADPDQEDLYGWIRNESPRDAVFVDTWRTIPVLGQRALYVALDGRPTNGRMDGWKISSDDFLKLIQGYSADAVDRRFRVARAFYAPSEDFIAADTLDAIARDLGERPLYVVARDPTARNRLAVDFHFRSVFSGPAGAIYVWLRGATGPGPQVMRDR